MIEFEQEIVSLTKVTSLAKNYPGKIIIFYSANNCLQKSAQFFILVESNFYSLKIIVEYKAPLAAVILQY
jgi:hypothetical protein